MVKGCFVFGEVGKVRSHSNNLEFYCDFKVARLHFNNGRFTIFGLWTMVLLEDSNIVKYDTAALNMNQLEFMNAWNMNQLWLFDVSHVDHSRKSEKGSQLFCLQHICWVIIALCTARWKKMS